MDRISRDDLFMAMALLVGRRGTCRRRHSGIAVGAVIVMKRRVISMGYAGAPAGMPHCIDVGCDLSADPLIPGCQRTVHAEANAIAFAARVGIPTVGCTLFCTHEPCKTCAKLILNAGIKDLVYMYPYPTDPGGDLIKSCGGICRLYKPDDVVI